MNIFNKAMATQEGFMLAQASIELQANKEVVLAAVGPLKL
jgi:hypothetical protein